jgi:hypothetical protein
MKVNTFSWKKAKVANKQILVADLPRVHTSKPALYKN